MPLYVYRCPEGHEVERLRPVAERGAPIFCERCLVVRGETTAMALAPALVADRFPGAGSWR